MANTNLSGSQEVDLGAPISGRAPVRWPLAVAMGVACAGAALAAAMQAWPGAWVPASGPAVPDTGRMVAAVAQIVGDGAPRRVDTPAAAAGRERITALFAAAGVTLEPHRVKLKRSVAAGEVELVNLVGRIPGTQRGAGTIGLVAHSDSARVSPGAGDDASGVAAVAEVAHSLAAHPPRHDVIVLLTDGEEAGLLGAQAFMAQHPWAAELTAVVNLDARGAAGSANVFELGPDTWRLVGGLRRHLAAPRTTSLAAWIYDLMPNGTDFTVFKRAGLTGYNVAFIGDHPAYHTEQDTPERLNRSTLQHFGHTALALTRALDELETSGASAPGVERAAWMDVLGLWVIAWPERWSAALACAAGVLVLIPAVWRAAKSVRAARAIGLTVGALLLALVVAALIGWGFTAGAAWTGTTTHSQPWRTVALNWVLWIAAAVLVVGAGAVVARRSAATESTAFAGVWTVWVVVACAGGFLLPAASPLLVAPVALAGVGALLAGRWGPTAAVCWGSLAGLAGAVAAWVPLEPAFLDALGMSLAAATGARAVLVLAPALPLVVLAIGAPAPVRAASAL